MDLEKLHCVLAWVAKVWGMAEVRRLLATWFPPAKVSRLAPPTADETADDDAIYWERTRATVNGIVTAYRTSKGRRWEAKAMLALLASGATV